MSWHEKLANDLVDGFRGSFTDKSKTKEDSKTRDNASNDSDEEQLTKSIASNTSKDTWKQEAYNTAISQNHHSSKLDFARACH